MDSSSKWACCNQTTFSRERCWSIPSNIDIWAGYHPTPIWRRLPLQFTVPCNLQRSKVRLFDYFRWISAIKVLNCEGIWIIMLSTSYWATYNSASIVLYNVASRFMALYKCFFNLITTLALVPTRWWRWWCLCVYREHRNRWLERLCVGVWMKRDQTAESSDTLKPA